MLIKKVVPECQKGLRKITRVWPVFGSRFEPVAAGGVIIFA